MGVGSIDSGGRGGPTYFGVADSFYLYSRRWTGDGQIVARITGMTGSNTGHAGLMIRASTDSAAPNVFGYVIPGGLFGVSSRSAQAAETTRSSSSTLLPVWVKLVRASGGVMTYTSPDGVNWTEYAWRTVSLPAEAAFGFGVSGRGSVSTAAFDNVSVGPITTSLSSLAPPSGLAVTTIGADYATFTWTNSTSNYQQVELQRSTDGTTFTTVGAWNARPTTATDNRLSSARTYYYRVAAVRGTTAAYSNVVTVTTPPIVLSVAGVWSNRVSLTWTCDASPEVVFLVQHSTDNVTFNYGQSVPRDQRSYSLDFLSPNTTYYIRIGTGFGVPVGFSNVVTVTTATSGPPPGAPAAPTNLRPVFLAPGDIQLAWDDRSENETSFQVEKSTDGGATYFRYLVAPANATTVTDAVTPPQNQPAYYRVRAVNDSGTSNASNSISVTLPQINAPSDLAAVVPSVTRVELSWRDNSANETGFEIRRGTSSGSGIDGVRTLGMVPANTTTYVDTTVEGTTGYWYYVRALVAGGGSQLANPVFVARNAGAPIPIAGVTAPGPGVYNGSIDFVVTYASPVVVTGSPALSLTIGGASQRALYLSGSGTSVLTFRFTPPPAGVSGGLELRSPIDVNGGSITGVNGAATSASFTPPDTSGVFIDSIPPAAPVITLAGQTSTPTFGGIAESRSTVTVTRQGGGVVGSTVASQGADGTGWTLAWSGAALAPGTYSFTARARDAAGNISASSSAITVTVATSPNPGPGGGTPPPTTPPPTTPPPTTPPPPATTPPPTTTPPPPTTTPPPPATIPPPTGTPPPTSTPPPATTPPPVVVTPPAPTAPTAKSDQTITFVSPVGAIAIGQSISLGATSSAGLPITYSIVSGDAMLAGNTLTPRSPATLIVRASSAGSETVNPASVEVNFGSPQKAAQSIDTGPVGVRFTNDPPITLSARASSGLPVSYALVSGPATLSGNTLTLTGGAGTVVVRAVQGGNDATAAAETLLTFEVRAAGQQVFLGGTGADPFAAVIAADNSHGVLLLRVGSTGEGLVAKFAVSPDGTFSTRATNTAGQVRSVGGRIVDGVLTASIAELGVTLSANVVPARGDTAALAGLYTAHMTASAAGTTYIVAGPARQAFALTVTLGSTAVGSGSLEPDGAVTIAMSGGATLVAKIDPASGTLRGTFGSGPSTAAFAGLSDNAPRTDKLVNLSSRLRVNSGDSNRAVIAGFVISGTTAKRVLIRAVGPGLTAFGVPQPLASPRVQLFDSRSVLLAANAGWNNSTEVAAAATAVGAFQLAAGSRDAALVATLAPGAYTAQVLSEGGEGIVLLEVYDAAGAQPPESPQLINISTRGLVDTGDGVLVAGFVITGNAPKRVLVRGVGPGLNAFGVNGVVNDPVLHVFTTASTVPIAQNDNWETAQPIVNAQSAARAADLTAAARAVGAFPLAAASKDAALIVTLLPGNYTAVVSGAGTTTGVGLVEVYEWRDN